MKLKGKLNLEQDNVEQEDYRSLLGDYLIAEPAVRQNRALRNDVRYIIFADSPEIYAVEERGDWDHGQVEPVEYNEYRLIRRNGVGIVEEKIGWEEARELLVDHSNFSL